MGLKQPKPRIFRSANTKFTSFAPPEGCRLAMTQVRIDNSNECQFCLRIDIGSRTRFLAYLGRGDLVSNRQIDASCLARLSVSPENPLPSMSRSTSDHYHHYRFTKCPPML